MSDDMPHTDEEWQETLRQFSEDVTIELTQLQDQVFVHYKNGKNYIFVDVAKIQIGDKWKRAVIYREEGGTDLYVRSFMEFIHKFKWPKDPDINRPSATPQIAPPKTPMCDRLRACGDQHRFLVEFVDALGERGCEIAHTEELHMPISYTDLIFEFLEIDKQQLEEERRSLLEYQRKLNES